MDSLSIGLDIGSSAVRAAEVELSQGRRVVRRYGQVGIPNGWVVDGEIVNSHGVAEAIRHLWAETRFSSNKVVVGVSGPRVFVRQADVPNVDAAELRSSLKFNGQELVPIPLDDASFDFSVIDSASGSEEPAGGGKRLLLVAAHKDVLHNYLEVVRAAGLSAVAMDSSALALLRAVPPSAEDGMEVVVSIGAELTTVAVREMGVPRFLRTLTVGGNKLTSSLAESLHIEMAVAERLKRGAVPADTPQLAQTRKTVSTEMRDLAEDVRATVDFFSSQSDHRDIQRIMVTGGASQTNGLAAAIGGNLPVQVYQVAPFAGLELADLGIDEQGLSRAGASATTAVGLALWPFESPLIRLSILPEEVIQARANRRRMQFAAGGLAALIGVLAVVGGGRILQVRHEQAAVKAADRQNAALTASMQQLQARTAIHGRVQTLGQTEVSALTGDVDWVRTLGRLAAVMPANLHITSFSGSRVTGTSSGSASGAVGTLNVSVTGAGNASAAADWLDALLKDPDLSGTVISGITVTDAPAKVSFTSTSNLTSSSQSSRAQAAKP